MVVDSIQPRNGEIYPNECSRTFAVAGGEGHPDKRKDLELEIKFRTSAEGLKAALNSPELVSVKTRNQNDRTIYFDTSRLDIQKHGSTLRLRKSGRALPVQCFKSRPVIYDSPFERREFQVRIREMQPDIAMFDQAAASELAGIIGSEPLEPCFETIIHRRTRTLHYRRSTFEAAFDKGVVKTSEQQVGLVELELELKAGTAEDLYSFAEQLCTQLPLSLDFTSKAAKGYALRQNRAFQPSKTASIKLQQSSTWDDLIAATLSETLRHFVTNWAALRTSDEPEAVHQMRVALRRMRSAFAMFSHDNSFPQFHELGEKAKQIASVIGPARECDVFLMNALQGPLASPLRPSESDVLLARVEEQRRQCYAVARALLEDPKTSEFVLTMQSMIASRSWSIASPDTPPHTEGAETCARRTLDRLWKRARKRGKRFSNLGDEDRHRLRIAMKALRYGADFFSAIFQRPRRFQAFVDKVSALQDLLGTYNDNIATRKFLDALGPTPVPGAAKHFVLGWYARDEKLAANQLPVAWKRFKNARPYWR